jgi:hypothetical protein
VRVLVASRLGLVFDYDYDYEHEHEHEHEGEGFPVLATRHLPLATINRMVADISDRY